MNKHWKKRIQRVIGNWGVSFFTPLVSGGLGEMILKSNVEFITYLFIALINATVYTGLAISQEVKELGKEKGVYSP